MEQQQPTASTEHHPVFSKMDVLMVLSISGFVVETMKKASAYPVKATAPMFPTQNLHVSLLPFPQFSTSLPGFLCAEWHG